MNINKPDDIPTRDITPENTYFNRRNFMRGAILAGTVAASAWAFTRFGTAPTQETALPPELENAGPATAPTTGQIAAAFSVDEPQTSFQDITNYNNFYEFTTDKDGVADLAKGFVTRPWTVTVDGLCSKPTTFDIDDLLKIAPAESRVYRMRCVEAWSMVIPWNGFPISKLLDRVQPLSSARYVAFKSVLDPKQMVGQREGNLDFPYVEGLRMDEAMHPLAILASGLYGRQLPPQDGAPIRLVTPWKYGFKGIKSIVSISLVDKQPPTTWSRAAPDEYGFYANVNPNVPHPRWSQATERRIGGSGSIPTLMFNGYADQVASLYAGMDLHANF
jgi:sulfoxide reductase catalytic subunit YedY